MLCMIVCGVVLLLFLLAYVRTRNYEREFIEELDRKEHPLTFFYPMSLYLLMETRLCLLMEKNDQQKEKLMLLHIGEEEDLIQVLYWCKKISTMLVVVLISVCMAFLADVSANQQQFLKAGKYLLRQENEEQVALNVSSHGQKDQTVVVDIPVKQYTKKEVRQKMKEAKTYIKEHYLGDNQKKEEVWQNLNLMESIPDSAIEVSWWIEDETYLNRDGTLENEMVPEKGVKCRLTATLSCLEEEEELEFVIRIVPKKTITEKDWKKAVEKAVVEAGEKEETNKKYSLPSTILGKKVSYEQKTEKKGSTLLVLGIVLLVLLWIGYDSQLNKEIKAHDSQMMVDYPELVNKFTLLLSAGMTVNAAWGKIAGEYKKKVADGSGKKRFAYEEWCMTWNEMQNGVPEVKALEHFGQRSRLLAYMKFTSLIAHNLRKGSKGLLELLEYEAMDAFEERKQMTKRLAEEAGTKLLGPMMIMLLLVLMIIMVPAAFSM